jgi:glycosyltransferase involved in cell wall biosynthesis
MKVLHIEGGKNLYGGAYQVFNLLKLLKGHGEHTLACPDGSAIAIEGLKAGLDVMPIPLRGEASLSAYFALREIIRDKKPDIVHVHSRRGADLWGPLAAKFSGTPLIITRRVDNPEPRLLAKLRYGMATRVVGISQKICEVLQGEGVPESKLRCIRSGVDTHTYFPSASRGYLTEQFGIAPQEKVVVMAAQFIPRKGHATLLDAIPEILAATSHTRFLLLGKGPLLETVQARAESFGNHVLVPGFRTDFDRILPECSLLVHPAEMEGLGVVLLQAAACGVPVVASRAGGIPEAVKDGISGRLVPPGDAAALAREVIELLNNDALRNTMSGEARRFAVEELSVETTARANLALYEEILGGR